MPHLILIKHARPQIDPAVSSEHWRLGDEGRATCAPLADALGGYAFAGLVSSSEPKAVETAEIVSKRLGRPTRVADDLFEHDRRSTPHMDSRDFISLVALFFKRPGELVLGDETADEAYDRFAAAVDAVIAQEHGGDAAIVTHGTVIALFAQRRTRQEPFALWRRMGLPSFIVLDTKTWDVVEVRDRV